MQGLGIHGLPQQFGIPLVAQNPRDTGKCFQMIRASPFRSQQQEHQIHRLVIDGLEVDGFDQSGKNTDQTIKSNEFAVRNRDAMADSGRSEPFALQQCVENFPSR